MSERDQGMVEHKPFVPPSSSIPELTLLPILVGAVLGIIFGASSLYLALKVGMTVSASIPIAVLSITLFKAVSKVFGLRPATILENNIVQTTGSAGESIAFGVAVTMPALLILGYEMEISRIMLVSILGALLGILMMIPLRWALIVKNHKVLPYPEGTACAEVLIVGEKGGTSAITVFTGFFVALVYKVLNVGAKLWTDAPERIFTWYKGSYFATEVSPELLGVGYIIGPRIALITFGGGVLSAFVLTPAITLFGSALSAPLFPATKLISEMSVHEIWKNYVLYIGAGSVAAGGIISLFRSLPVIGRSLAASISGMKAGGHGPSSLRTDRDLPMTFVFLGVVAIIVAIWATPSLHMNLLGALLIVFFGFLFVTVSSRLTGEIGSSSNPISGMTVATLLLTCLIFVMIGWVGASYRLTALSVAAIVCIAASNGGTTSQDLKTGFLVGATPSAQQIAILIGSVTSAIVIGYTLLLLNDASTIYAKKSFPEVQFDVSQLPQKQNVKGPEAAHDSQEYHVLQLTEPQGAVAAGKYLVDSTGHIVYLVDPGVNGVLKARDDGTTVQKYEAPKARLMSLIIDGILTQKLPWALVLIGAFISIVLEFCGVASLPFAVGVYLPISVSAPIFFGGLTRWLVDRAAQGRRREEDSDSSPGVLYSSGLIAGGAIAGICIALLSLNENITKALDMSAIFQGGEVFAYTVFGLMVLSLYSVGRGWMLNKKS
ncbi:MAG: OPT family oligopeptide transporter [Bdellovibrionales bacterium]